MTKQSAVQQVALTIYFKRNRIRIHKSTLHAIGNPDYVLLLVNPVERALIILRSDRSDRRAYHIPCPYLENRLSCELCSKSLMRSLLNTYEGWQESNSYRINGEIVQKDCVAKFYMANSVPTNANGV